MHFVYILRCADNALYIGETPFIPSAIEDAMNPEQKTIPGDREAEAPPEE